MFDPLYPSGGLEAGSAWRYVSPARRFYCNNIGVFTLDVRDLQTFSDALNIGLLVFLELWLRTYPFH